MWEDHHDKLRQKDVDAHRVRKNSVNYYGYKKYILRGHEIQIGATSGGDR